MIIYCPQLEGLQACPIISASLLLQHETYANALIID